MMHANFGSSTRNHAKARRFKRLGDDRGTAAVEFALVFPFMLTLMFGMATLTERMLATRKVELAANALADLAAAKTRGGDIPGQAAITDADVTELFNAAAFLLSPLPVANLHIDVYEVASQQTYTTTRSGDMYITTPGPRVVRLAWKASQNGLNYLQCDVDLSFGADGAANTLPTEFKSEFSSYNTYMLVAHVSYDYTSSYGIGPFNWAKGSTSTIFRTGYARPRNVFNPAHIQDKASNATSCTSFSIYR